MYTAIFLSATIIASLVMIWGQRADHRTIIEPGVLVVMYFALCYLLPMLAIDLGLDLLLPDDPEAIDRLAIYGVLFMGSFTVFYRSACRFIPVQKVFRERPRDYVDPKWCLLAVIVFLAAKKMVLISYGLGETKEYLEQYVVYAGIPVAMVQALNLMQSVQWILLYLFLTTSFAAAPGKRSFRLIWIVFAVYIFDMVLTNSRSNFVTLSLAFAAAHNYYRRPLGLAAEITVALAGVFLLSSFSFLRVPELEREFSWINAVVPGEFASIYSNAIHLLSVAGSTGFISPPGNSYLEALIAFVPSQFNPDKWDLASWYAKAYFPEFAEAGGGLAFGFVPEAVVNFGWVSIVFQSFVVAVLLRGAYVLARQEGSSAPGMWVLFYVFCITQAYHVVRSSSFTIISGFVIGFVIPYLIVRLISTVMKASKQAG